jgi:hypothetical protein
LCTTHVVLTLGGEADRRSSYNGKEHRYGGILEECRWQGQRWNVGSHIEIIRSRRKGTERYRKSEVMVSLHPRMLPAGVSRSGPKFSTRRSLLQPTAARNEQPDRYLDISHSTSACARTPPPPPLQPFSRYPPPVSVFSLSSSHFAAFTARCTLVIPHPPASTRPHHRAMSLTRASRTLLAPAAVTAAATLH